MSVERHLSSDGYVELVGQTEARQAQLHPLGLLEGDSHIYGTTLLVKRGDRWTRAQAMNGITFDEVFHKKARIKVPLHDAGPKVVYTPSSTAHDISQLSKSVRLASSGPLGGYVPGASSALAHRLDHLVKVQSRLVPIQQTLHHSHLVGRQLSTSAGRFPQTTAMSGGCTMVLAMSIWFTILVC
jgi:hypothetical protein